jgi:hypothetical protein
MGKGLKYLDKNGKKIKHGAKYTYLSTNPYMPPVKGTVVWDRHLLAYMFHPENTDLAIVMVPLHWQGNATVVAWSFERNEG